MADERVWLSHPEVKDGWHCPIDAVERWIERGWRRDVQPPEVNPATAERALTPEPTVAAAVEEQAPVSKPAKKAGASAEGSD